MVFSGVSRVFEGPFDLFLLDFEQVFLWFYPLKDRLDGFSRVLKWWRFF